jgi:hypothetical protein
LALHIQRNRPNGLKYTQVSISIHTSIFRIYWRKCKNVKEICKLFFQIK